MTSDVKSSLKRWLLHPNGVLLVPFALALLVRLVGIASRPIWYDEAFAVLFAEKGVKAMLAGTLTPAGVGASDVHPLGYYSLLWAWMGLFGESLTSVRALSVLAGTATTLVASALALKLFGRQTALATGVLMALSPFQVHYGQEIRMYALLGLWLILATYCFWQGSQSARWGWWVGFAVFAALGQYTHNLAAFYLLSLAFWPLITRDWRVLRSIAVASGASLVLYLPWLIHLPAQFAKVNQAYWIETPGPYRLLTLLLAFVTNLPLQPGQLAVGLFAALSITILALIETTRAAKHQAPQWQRAAWILYLGFAAPLLVFLFSQWKPVYLERAFLPSGIAFCIWVAWALTQATAGRVARLLLIVMLVVGSSIGLYQHLTFRGFPYAPYGQVARSLRSRAQTGDVIVHSSKLSFLPTAYFDRDLPARYIADPTGSGVDTLARSTQQVLGLEASTDMFSAVGNARRVWFVIFDESNQEYVRAGYPGHPHLTWLMLRYGSVELLRWDDLDVYLFSMDSGT
jgi:4-amino-4-deoxy-L-arabinose transferase-like glycosyltransferase